MTTHNKRPLIGVGVVVVKAGLVLLGRRKNAHGHGSWHFPGGHLEFNEAIDACARREVMEETGLTIKNLKKGPYTNDFFEKEAKHYVTLFVIADYNQGEPTVREPHKCETWQWFDWNDLPHPQFVSLQNFITSGYTPFMTGLSPFPG